MKTKSIRSKWTAVLASSICLVAAFASATPIGLDFTTDESGYYYIGSIVDGNPSSESNELSWLNELLDLALNSTDVASTNPSGELLTRSSFGSSPLQDAVGGVKVEDDSDRTVGALGIYILGKYGAAGDPSGQETHVWYIGGLDEDDVVSLRDARNGLSHTTVFSDVVRVPDGGATVALFGAALLGLGAMRRKLKA